MKRFLSLMIVMILLVSLIGIVSAVAGSASISISGNSSVLAGKTYTYTYKLNVSSACLANTKPVKVSGVLEIVSGGEGLFHDTVPNNKNATLTSTVKVRVKSGAAPGETGSISINGEYMWMLENGVDYNKGTVSKSKTVKVVKEEPAPTKNPNVTPKPPEGWEIVTNSVKAAEKGAVVKGEMKDDYKIPESLLEKAVENENILEIDFGKYRCTIDPANLKDFEGIKSLNLKLDFEKAAGLSEVSGEKDVYQLHFGHTGQLPGKFTFTFEATENKPGDTVYLYYYYPRAEIIEGKMSAVVDEDGMVTFDIYHCSSYFVTSEVIEGALSNFDVESAEKIRDLTTELDEKQTKLDDANTKIETLTTEKTTLETAVEDAENEVKDLKAAQASAEANNKDQAEYSLVVLIAAVAAGILLAILLTMLITKAGLFKSTDEEKEAKVERKAAKLQAKQEAKDQKDLAKQQKEQAKQEALEAKQQAKAEAMEAKQQWKQEANQPDEDAVQQAAGEDESEL